MKKIFTIISFVMSLAICKAQPVINSGTLVPGATFNLYSLSNVNTANLGASGANVTWDLSAATATLVGTAALEDMTANPFASQYPAANFAIKFTPTGGPSIYSLFNLTNSVLEEVANNVGSPSATPFIDYRTALVFPFTFNLTNNDTYQKNGQGVKSISNTYDAYGTLIVGATTFSNVIRILTVDDGNTSINVWSSTPIMPIFQASSSGFTLWEITSTTNISATNLSNNLFDMYPNPATDQIKIINKKTILSIEVVNTQGQILITTKKSSIDISALASGIYFIKAYSNDGVASERFIKN